MGVVAARTAGAVDFMAAVEAVFTAAEAGADRLEAAATSAGVADHVAAFPAAVIAVQSRAARRG